MTTSKRFHLGLVVGKFSPLHLGHEHLIEVARQACNHVLVLGYSQPAFPGCDRARRHAWISRRFPDVINIQVDDADIMRRCEERGIPHRAIPLNTELDLAQQSYLAWLLDGPIGQRPDAMFGSEHYIEPCATLLSQHFGKEVTPICVDLLRTLHPISATRIRQDVHAARPWLSASTYVDFVPRVVLLGGESSGKTTLAQALAERHGTVWVPEYGRERWDLQQGQLSLDDLIDIGRVQILREDEHHRQANRWLFCDTSPLTTLGYAGWMFGKQPQHLLEMAERRYDLAILCHPDFAFVQDGTRRDDTFRLTQHEWYRAQLTARQMPWIDAFGNLPQRVAQVDQALASLTQTGKGPRARHNQ